MADLRSRGLHVRLSLLAVLGLLAAAGSASAGVTEFSHGISQNANPDQIVAGPDGALWFTESGIGRIGRITTGGQITEFGGIKDTEEITGIAAAPDGNLWFTQVNGIGRITPSGQVTEFRGQGSWPDMVESFMTTGPDGQLWFLERPYLGSGPTSEVAHATTDGQWTASIPIPGNPYLYGIASASDGNVWYVQDSPAGLGRITPDGQVTQFLSGFSPSDTLAGLIAGPDGALWFLDSTSASLGRMTTAGALTWFHLPVKPGPPASGYPAPTLTGLTVGPGGNLWFSDGNLVGRFSPSSGKAVTTRLGLSDAVKHIVLGPDGNLWFTEPGAIGRMSPSISCLVPDLRGTKPARIAGLLAATTCALGRTSTGARLRGGTLGVVKQYPAPQTVAPEGASVTVQLGTICSPPRGGGWAGVVRLLCNGLPLAQPPLVPQPLPARLRSFRPELVPKPGGRYVISFWRGDNPWAYFVRDYNSRLNVYFQPLATNPMHHARIAGRRVQWACGSGTCVYGWHEGGFSYIASGGGAGLGPADIRAMVANARVPG